MTDTWKGLDTAKKPVFIGYDRAEGMIAALLDRAAAWGPDAVVGIVRGGLVPASMAAGILALPLSFLGHDKTAGTMHWIGPPARGRRVLLVDDCCSSGGTLRLGFETMRAEGRACLTLTVVYDPDVARYVPDLSHPMRDLFRLPWERGEATPTGRAAKAAGETRDLSAEAPFHGIALTRTLLKRMAAEQGIAPGRASRFPSERAVLIADGLFPFDDGPVPIDDGRDSAPPDIQARLAGTPYRHLPVVRTAENAHQAAVAMEWGCTHFLACAPDQAIRMSAEMPHLIVTWWSLADDRGWIVGAAARPRF